MARTYYTLAIFEDNVWSPQFGDYVRSVVEQERKDSYSQYKKKNTKIIRHDDNMHGLKSTIQHLNGLAN